ncbi:Asp-tRNA(Asn)/Glu-tRNA(Gln) amidotransferase subunit GatB [Endomicrobium proavitum]|uniref:Aspartyl/glutamyl-tRNA(Asn/Gln) amidotransferase subunit B n=1 Tax=Endomicrobium proavitum TaxID=1408281 RepID=A0A0G3WHR8_9BACT|nr:Asp-tRNA(Asn)/Glu-tRNA(Gln) amidotransferase subunit GatB [Endomicrobium proavitum]AKL98201.1 Aspartyl/glutamyl-tRNA(Asn/Gln) amidotransferase subunit B [Endomicrobium proavitum]
MTAYETTIGLEVHMQINTKSKVFCECSTEFGAEPNSHTCVICTSQPGAIPILNKKAVEAVIKTGLALGFTINKQCTFARKQYFYPDVPKNYQITQAEPPLCSHGKIAITVDGKEKILNITRIHLEEDAGKLVHEIGARKLDYSLLDLNRASVGLMELVTEPELTSAQEAEAFLTELKNIVQYLGASECSMEEGKMRCDVNVSIRPVGQTELGTRVEIKNMNSISGIVAAITYEAQRQKEVLISGGKLTQETRLWEAEEGVTKSMRSKEGALDYRYFPEPDLVPFNLPDSFIEEIRAQIPELPKAKKTRFIAEYALSDYDADYLTSTRIIADYYETALAASKDKKAAAKPLANWISTELNGKLNAEKKDICDSPVTSENLAKLIELILNGTISGKIAKTVFDDMYANSSKPEDVVKAKGLVQISDESALIKLAQEAIDETPKAVAEFKAGKERAVGSLVGAVMKKSKGQANPQLVNKILLELLKK